MPCRVLQKQKFHTFLFGERTTGVLMVYGLSGTGKTAIVNLKTDEYVRSEPSARVIKIRGKDIKAYRSLMTLLAMALTEQGTKKMSVETSTELVYGHFNTSQAKTK